MNGPSGAGVPSGVYRRRAEARGRFWQIIVETHAVPSGSPSAGPTLSSMTQMPDDNLDHYALGFHAPRKGLRRQDCPYAEGTEAHAQWTAGYDAAVNDGDGA